MDVAKSLPASVGSIVATAAKLQFVSGMHTALVIGAGVVLHAAIYRLRLPAGASWRRPRVGRGAANGFASLNLSAVPKGASSSTAEAALLKLSIQ